MQLTDIGPLISLGGVLIASMISIAGVTLAVLNRRMDKLASAIDDINDKYETHLYWHMENPVSGDD